MAVGVAKGVRAMEGKCHHGKAVDGCNQCRIEAMSDAELLIEVEGYAANVRASGVVPKGWWVELARRLRDRSP
jgi:hypothetical protein